MSSNAQHPKKSPIYVLLRTSETEMAKKMKLLLNCLMIEHDLENPYYLNVQFLSELYFHILEVVPILIIMMMMMILLMMMVMILLMTTIMMMMMMMMMMVMMVMVMVMVMTTDEK